MEFTAYYQPNAVGTQQTEALFIGNTTKDKLNSIWRGNAYTDIPENDPDRPELVNNTIIMKNDFKRIKEIKIFDILGRPVDYRQPDESDNQIVIDISNLPNGLYLLFTGQKFFKVLKL